jgi:hypothetical protein
MILIPITFLNYRLNKKNNLIWGSFFNYYLYISDDILIIEIWVLTFPLIKTLTQY